MEKRKPRLTVQEAAFELGVSDKHIYNLLREGLLIAFDVSCSGRGGKTASLRIDRESMDKFLKKRAVSPEKYCA